ncbi:MAG: sugar transferase [Verrucomicrobia bacterium]|nr:sugar transferase [Verrucomicrobiota bacterium]
MPLRRLVLFTGDLVCIVGSIVLSSVIRLTPTEGMAYVIEHIPSLGGSVLIFLVVFYVAGLYERETLLLKRATFVPPLVAVGISLIVIIVIFYARFRLHIGRGILLLAGFFIFWSVWGIRRLYRVAAGYGFLNKSALIVGDSEEAENIIRLVAGTPDSGMKLFGIVSSTSGRPGDFIAGVPVLGRIDRLREIAGYDIETIIVATSLSREPSLLRLLRPLRYAGVEVLDYASLYEKLAREIPLNHIDDEWLMHAAMNSSRIHIRKFKRAMDISIALIGLILSAPIAMIAAIAIPLNSKGPIFYHQKRVGQDGRAITVIKFRTMRMNAEKETGAVWAMAVDTRVTRVGRFLRKTRIDEIPQLINVLLGDMSLVGPRPERPEFIDALAEVIPFYRERLLVPPGVTGWAQVKYPYAASVEAARRKLQFDLYYIKHMSFYLDVLILLRTFRTIVTGLTHSESGVETAQEEGGSISVLHGKV